MSLSFWRVNTLRGAGKAPLLIAGFNWRESVDLTEIYFPALKKRTKREERRKIHSFVSATKRPRSLTVFYFIHFLPESQYACTMAYSRHGGGSPAELGETVTCFNLCRLNRLLIALL
jgi:hypothetical protein